MTKVLVALLLCCATAGCTTITARHDPLYREQPHTSQIRATAQNTSVGIASITIDVTSGAMTDCSGFAVVPGMSTRSILPCRVGATLTTNTCTFSGAPAVATCSVSVPVQTSTLVTYVVTAVSASGQSTKSPEIAYGGGSQVPERLARPVYWHRQLSRSSRIDLGFFPDGDYLVLIDPYRGFTDDVDAILVNAFFNTTDQFARAYTGDRQFFNLWAGPFGADAQGCTRSFSANAQDVSAVMDGSAIVHRNVFRDCGSITAGGGAGSVQSSASDPGWLLVHESGHFLFQLSDEYAGGGYVASVPCPNVYASKSACDSAAPGVGWCTQIGTTGFWRVVSENETMADRVLGSDFRDDAGRCVSDRISKCSSGNENCY